MVETIQHKGIVAKVEGDCVVVRILQESACSGCAAKKLCNSAESKEKLIEVVSARANGYEVGQEVMLEGRLSDGRWASLLAYALPLLLLLATLLVMTLVLHCSEALSAGCSLAVLVPYYGLLYLFRARLQRRFSFEIR